MKYNKLDQHLLSSIHGDKYTETKVTNWYHAVLWDILPRCTKILFNIAHDT
jgi:hypothetical protein